MVDDRRMVTHIAVTHTALESPTPDVDHVANRQSPIANRQSPIANRTSIIDAARQRRPMIFVAASRAIAEDGPTRLAPDRPPGPALDDTADEFGCPEPPRPETAQLKLF